MPNIWSSTTFLISLPSGPAFVSGYTHRGIGMHHDGWRRPRKLTEWTVTHLGSGAIVARLRGDVFTVFPIATAIAECSDWTLFDMPDGWRQTDPDLRAKVRAILEAHADIVLPLTLVKVPDEVARSVIAAREAANA